MIGFDELGRKGWLGNQMFQYAALRGIAAHHDFDFCIPPNDNTRVTNYLLHDIFMLPSVNNVGYVGGLYRHSSSDDICHSTTFNFNQKFFDECPDDVNISGFFQSEKWFKHIENSLKKDFVFKEEIYSVCKSFLESFEQKPIFIHVRRGDYVKRPEYHHNLSMDYFEEGLSYFDDDIPVLIFSDDVQWCKEQKLFESDRFNISETTDRLPLNSFLTSQNYDQGALVPYYDMCFMTMCDGGIISNSSFGWWGAWLQDNRTRPIVCPNKDKWAGPKNTVDYTDVVVEGWKAI